MSNDAKATSARRPGRPKAGSEDKKARILSKALTLFQRRATRPRPSRPSLMPVSVRHALATTVQLMKKIPYEKI